MSFVTSRCDAMFGPRQRTRVGTGKRLQIVLGNMNPANSNVAQEAEQRAQQMLCLARIPARSSHTKTKGRTAHRWLTHKQRDAISASLTL